MCVCISAAPNYIRVRKLLYDFTVRYTTTRVMYEAPKVCGCAYVCGRESTESMWLCVYDLTVRYTERWGAGVEYYFQEFNEPYAPS